MTRMSGVMQTGPSPVHSLRDALTAQMTSAGGSDPPNSVQSTSLEQVVLQIPHRHDNSPHSESSVQVLPQVSDADVELDSSPHALNDKRGTRASTGISLDQ